MDNKTVKNSEGIEFEIRPIPSGHTCPDCMKDIMCSDNYRTLVDGRRIHSECGPAPIKLHSIDSIPAQWSFTIGVDSIDWFEIRWYRWYFDKEVGMKMSKTIDWNLRRFWKVNIEP